MKAAAYSVVMPTTIAEAVGCLVAAGPSARLLAGGQTLMPLMAARTEQPGVVIDLARVAGLDGVWLGTNDDLVIGAMARQRVVEQHPLVIANVPLLARAIPNIAHVTVRNQGTVGGSIANADPTAELPTVAMAIGATMVVAGPGGERRIAAAEFFVGPCRTSMAADELLIEVRFPVEPPASRSGSAFAEFSRRPGDVALASAAAIVRLDDDGRVAHVGAALGSVGPTPMRADATSRRLVGAEPTVETVAAAVADGVADLAPLDDLHATAAYRRHLAGVLLRRAITAACAEARR